jgi:hypothetical protein
VFGEGCMANNPQQPIVMFFKECPLKKQMLTIDGLRRKAV